jgi:hypothetical protein
VATTAAAVPLCLCRQVPLRDFKSSGREGPVEPGSYATAINVHNPHAHAVAIRKKASLLYHGEHPEEAVERPTPPVQAKRP